MSINDRESELNNAVLRYICQCQVYGDFKALEKLGIDSEVLDKLKSMTVNEVLHTSNIRSPFASITVDNKMLKNLFNHVSREAHAQQLITDLIANGAPLKLMRELTGIHAIEFSARRKMLNVDYLGRTQSPTAEQEMSIYKYWRNLDMRTTLSGEEWLWLAQQTELPIRLICKIIYEDHEENMSGGVNDKAN